MDYGYHLVAHANPGLRPLLKRDNCAELWSRLRRSFPDAYACILMPDHLHLVTTLAKPSRAQWELGTLLRAWTQSVRPSERIWAPVPLHEPMADMQKLRRQIRYVHLNPCRAGLTSDPLKWEWSTHRDLLGCVVDPWPDLKTMARIFGSSLGALPEKAHSYISGDPSVRVNGTPSVQGLRSGQSLATSWPNVLKAVATATRSPMTPRRGAQRALAVQVANQIGLSPRPDQIGMSSRTWFRANASAVDERAIEAVLKVLADPRCLSE